MTSHNKHQSVALLTKALCVAGLLGLNVPQSVGAQGTKATGAETQVPECATETAVNGAYKGVYYANDFDYLAAPCIAPNDPRGAVEKTTDSLKQIDIAPAITLSLGGEMRLRYHNENNIGSSRLDGRDDEFALTRVRAYADIQITDYFRGYVEMIDARKSGGALPPRGIEVVRTNVLNGFGEFHAPVANGRAMVRAGRQELLFGAQRLISPLEWGNTRRSFDGFRASYESERFAIDGWFVNPRAISDRSSSRNSKIDFSGLYGQYFGLPGHAVEVYALHLDVDDPLALQSQFWTVGGRVADQKGLVNWEVEAARQTGNNEDGDISAWMLTISAGLDFSQSLPFSPQVSVAYDRASGDGDDTDGKAQTFNQLFPLGHAYLGSMDLIGRQNIEAFSAKLSAKPHKRITTALTFHDFNLSKATDALYNAGGAAIRRDATGAAGTNVGQELDATITYTPSRWYNLQLGYGRFWAGRFVKETNGTGVSGNADFFYLQSTIRF